MKRIWIAAAIFGALIATATSQQPALAPWFDADGFYNRPGAGLERVTNDMTACRIESARLRTVRNTNSQLYSGASFNAAGAYDPVVAGAAVGVASIMFAIQDRRYNGAIEQIEFRDCAVALGYRHFRLGEREREGFDAGADRGFASLVAAATPVGGQLNEGESDRNYFAAEVATTHYQNAAQRSMEVAPEPVHAALSSAGSAEASALPALAERPIMAGAIARAAPGETVSAQAGMAILIVSASQHSGAMLAPVGGDTFRFTRVTADGAFVDLLQPTTWFGVRSHMNSERRRDPTLAGDFRSPRYSTFLAPAGRYVLSDLGALNACLGTLTFEVREGEVVYLGDLVLRPPSLPVAPLFNPMANINSGMDNRLRAELRIGIGDAIEAARTALQSDAAAKAHLVRVTYQNGYRIPCTGRYIGRVSNPDWTSFAPGQASAFHDAMSAAVAGVQ